MDNPTLHYRILCWFSCLLCAAALIACYWLNQRLSYTQRVLAVERHQAQLPDPHAAAKHRDQDFEFVIRNYGFEYQGQTGDVVEDTVLFCGAWEKDIAFFMRDYLQRRNNQRAVFIDVSCSAGYHSLFLSRHVHQIHAFDPYLPAIERFREMIERNGFTSIQVHPVGLGDKDEHLSFFEPLDENFSTGTFRDRDDQHRSTNARLQIVRGDDYLAPFQLSDLELIKMDIEGFEESALRGLRRSLEMHRPTVVLEVTTPPGGTIGSLAQLQGLFPKDYRFLIFLDGETTSLDGRYQLIDFEPEATTFFSKGFQANLVAFPAEKQRHVPRSRPKLARPALKNAASLPRTDG